MKPTTAFIILICIFAMSVPGIAIAQERADSDDEGTIVWEPKAKKEAVEKMRIPSIFSDEYMSKKTTEFTLNQDEKWTFVVVLSDVDTVVLKRLGHGWIDGSYNQAGFMTKDSVTITVADGIKAEIKDATVEIDNVQAKWIGKIEVTAGKKTGRFPIKINVTDPGQKDDKGTEILPNPTDVNAVKISGTKIDPPISERFDIIVSEKKIDRPVPSVTWSPDPSEARANRLAPKFKNKFDEEIYLLKLDSGKKDTKTSITVFLQDFDSITLKDVPGFEDQKTDRYGNMDPTWVTYKISEGLKCEVKLSPDAKNENGFYEAELIIETPEKPGEYTIEVTFADKGEKDKDGNEILALPPALSKHVQKATGTKIDPPVTRTLKIEVK